MAALRTSPANSRVLMLWLSSPGINQTHWLQLELHHYISWGSGLQKKINGLHLGTLKEKKKSFRKTERNLMSQNRETKLIFHPVHFFCEIRHLNVCRYLRKCIAALQYLLYHIEKIKSSNIFHCLNSFFFICYGVYNKNGKYLKKEKSHNCKY